ncbi:MAG: LemA family protein [Acidobacteriota bacterium]|nr:LemA family protein [Acidobacteriota bacterium]
MSVLFTLVVLAVAGLWGVAVYTRLISLRGRVTGAWKLLDAQLKAGGEPPTTDAARRVYNDAVINYNEALQAFPANIIAGLSGFQAAKPFDSRN